MERGEMERHRYPTIADRVGWWVSEWPVLSRIVLIVLVSVVGIVMVLAMQAAYASDGQGQSETTVTLSLTNFLGIIFGLISLLISGPVAWILKKSIDEQKEMRNAIKETNDKHDALKEAMLTRFLPRAEHDTSNERLEVRLGEMRIEITNKLDQIFEAIGQLERNKADKPSPFGGHAT